MSFWELNFVWYVLGLVAIFELFQVAVTFEILYKLLVVS